MITSVRCVTIAVATTTTCWTLNLLLYVSYHSQTTSLVSPRVIPEPLASTSPSMKAPLVVVVCDAAGGGNGSESLVYNATTPEEATEFSNRLRNSWVRQAEQLTTMLKTLLYFSRSAKWRIIVMTDTFSTFQRVVNLAGSLPQHHRQRLQLQNRKIWFPEGYPELMNHWRPCVWAKLFLSEALPDEDAVIYLDTDVVFLGPAEELWLLLRSMEKGEAVALAPEAQYKMDDPRRPYAGRAGLNTGMMAVNLTRVRQLAGGGLGSAILLEGGITPPARHDQDALNHFLRHRPHLLKEVTSRWNFLPSSCFPVAPACPDCLSHGILVLHGADLTFYTFVDKKFMVGEITSQVSLLTTFY